MNFKDFEEHTLDDKTIYTTNYEGFSITLIPNNFGTEIEVTDLMRTELIEGKDPEDKEVLQKAEEMVDQLISSLL